MEILNKDEIAAICSITHFSDDHNHILASLRARYPEWEFSFIAERGMWHSAIKGLVDSNGVIVADDFRAWVSTQYEAAGRNAKEVWDKYKDEGMVLTEWQRSTVYLATPYGTEPDAYLQIELEVKREVTWRYAFESDPWSEPDDLDDLISPMSSSPPEQELQPPRYEMKRIVDVRRFVREMVSAYQAERIARLPEMEKKKIHYLSCNVPPGEGYEGSEPDQPIPDIPLLELYPDWLTWEHPCKRLFRDWVESSAGGSGCRFCDHWYLQTAEYETSDGVRHFQAIPQWADRDGGINLPEIQPLENVPPNTLINSLTDFDNRAGYPFAWYFYMLHGNRINYIAGQIIVQGLKNSLLQLPACDEKVLLRWYERQYGF